MKDKLPHGHFQKPALFVGAMKGMRVKHEDILGRCASFIKPAELEEALAVANDTKFGLLAGICTGSLTRVREFQRRSTGWTTMTNKRTAGIDYLLQFGGRRDSSHGLRQQGRYAAEFYTRQDHLKTLQAYRPVVKGWQGGTASGQLDG